MYYEYHLGNGSTHLSHVANLNYVEIDHSEYCSCCGSYLHNTMHIDVKFCVIREGQMPIEDDGNTDSWVENVELGD